MLSEKADPGRGLWDAGSCCARSSSALPFPNEGPYVPAHSTCDNSSGFLSLAMERIVIHYVPLLQKYELMLPRLRGPGGRVCGAHGPFPPNLNCSHPPTHPDGCSQDGLTVKTSYISFLLGL